MTLLMREREKYKEGVAAGMAKGMAAGRTEGAVQACKKFNLSLQETVQYLIDNLNLTLHEAEENANKYWD